MIQELHLRITVIVVRNKLMGQNNVPKIKTEPLLKSIRVSNHVVLQLATKWIYFGAKVFPFDSIRIHYALSIDLEVWIGTASADVLRVKKHDLEVSYLDVKSLNAALNSWMKK